MHRILVQNMRGETYLMVLRIWENEDLLLVEVQVAQKYYILIFKIFLKLKIRISDLFYLYKFKTKRNMSLQYYDYYGKDVIVKTVNVCF